MSRESRLEGERSLMSEADGDFALDLFRQHVHAIDVREWEGVRVISPPSRFENTMDWLLRIVASEPDPEAYSH
jgi:hypothetical protein